MVVCEPLLSGFKLAFRQCHAREVAKGQGGFGSMLCRLVEVVLR